ncbi:MAG: hypothetical protein AAFX55_02755 [Bacteroidota bacterium]
MKFFMTILFVAFSLCSFAQKVEKDGRIYEVKKERIFLNGEDVTDRLNAEKRSTILKEATMVSDKMKLEEKARKAERKKEKKAKKLEKEVKKAEKEQKRVEKALRKEQKLKGNYKKAQDKLAKAQKKYGKLKKKGKLSPIDESKWLEKIEKLTEKVEKAKRKL